MDHDFCMLRAGPQLFCSWDRRAWVSTGKVELRHVWQNSLPKPMGMLLHCVHPE